MIPACEGSSPSSPATYCVSNVKNRFPSSESSPTNDLMVFTGSANLQLAKDVTKNLAIKLGKASVSRFSDNEISIEILEHVRGKDIFVLQSTCFPSNDNLMEILLDCRCP